MKIVDNSYCKCIVGKPLTDAPCLCEGNCGCNVKESSYECGGSCGCGDDCGCGGQCDCACQLKALSSSDERAITASDIIDLLLNETEIERLDNDLSYKETYEYLRGRLTQFSRDKLFRIENQEFKLIEVHTTGDSSAGSEVKAGFVDGK